MRGRSLTTFGQFFGGISNAFLPVYEGLGWLVIQQDEKLSDRQDEKLFAGLNEKMLNRESGKLGVMQGGKLVHNIRG